LGKLFHRPGRSTTYRSRYHGVAAGRAIKDLFDYLERKASEIRTVENILKKSPRLRDLLNHRQLALLNRALKKPHSVFYVESHRSSHNVAYQTARTDLLKLEELGLLEKRKRGKVFVFMAPVDLRRRLEQLEQRSVT